MEMIADSLKLNSSEKSAYRVKVINNKFKFYLNDIKTIIVSQVFISDRVPKPWRRFFAFFTNSNYMGADQMIVSKLIKRIKEIILDMLFMMVFYLITDIFISFPVYCNSVVPQKDTLNYFSYAALGRDICKLKMHIEDLRIGENGDIYVKQDSNEWINISKNNKKRKVEIPSLPGSRFKLKINTIGRKIRIFGYKIIKDAHVVDDWKGACCVDEFVFKKWFNVSLLEKDRFDRYWVKVTLPKIRNGKVINGQKDWLIICDGKMVISSMKKSWERINVDSIKIGIGGEIYYRKDNNWYKKINIHKKEIQVSYIDTNKLIDKDNIQIEIVPYLFYDSYNDEGKEILLIGRKKRLLLAKYNIKDQIINSQILGEDKQGRIYIYIKRLDNNTKRKLSRVIVYFPEKNHKDFIVIKNNEIPVLGLDGFLYTFSSQDSFSYIKGTKYSSPEEKAIGMLFEAIFDSLRVLDVKIEEGSFTSPERNEALAILSVDVSHAQSWSRLWLLRFNNGWRFVEELDRDDDFLLKVVDIDNDNKDEVLVTAIHSSQGEIVEATLLSFIDNAWKRLFFKDWSSAGDRFKSWKTSNSFQFIDLDKDGILEIRNLEVYKESRNDTLVKQYRKEIIFKLINGKYQKISEYNLNEEE